MLPSSLTSRLPSWRGGQLKTKFYQGRSTYEVIGELSARWFATLTDVAEGVYVQGMFAWWQPRHVDGHSNVAIVRKLLKADHACSCSCIALARQFGSSLPLRYLQENQDLSRQLLNSGDILVIPIVFPLINLHRRSPGMRAVDSAGDSARRRLQCPRVRVPHRPVVQLDARSASPLCRIPL